MGVVLIEAILEGTWEGHAHGAREDHDVLSAGDDCGAGGGDGPADGDGAWRLSAHRDGIGLPGSTASDGQAADREARHPRSIGAGGDEQSAAASIRAHALARAGVQRRAASHRRGTDDFAALHRGAHDRADPTGEDDAGARDRHGFGLSGGGFERVRGRGLHDRSRARAGPRGDDLACASLVIAMFM